MNKCKRRCSTDPNCHSFHYYLLDPYGVTNCWIWTAEGYSNNGSNKAYCFVKTNVEEIDEADEPVNADNPADESTINLTLDEDRRVPDASLEDWDQRYQEMRGDSTNTEPAQNTVDDHLDGSKPCFTYRETGGCVMGENMRKIRDISFEQCQTACDKV